MTARPTLLLLSLGWLAACAPEPAGPPSVLLFVMDTVRADAVSAYGEVEGTTPVTDALAAEGLRYTRAYAESPWTLPSHATLFSGLGPGEHGVTWRSTRAPDDLVMLAERMREAGWATYGYSENAWISEYFNMAQGFDGFEFRGAPEGSTPAEERIAEWLAPLPDDQPVFVFVNVIDAHIPYQIRGENPHLPRGVTLAAAQSIPQQIDHYLCVGQGRARELAILRGLYRGEVRAADAKLGLVLEALERAGRRDHLITIVTSDHGEALGEHGLFGHQFSVHEPLLRVPLVVHGLGTRPEVLDEPVRLADVVPSLLAWTGQQEAAGLPGRPLPTARQGDPAPRPIVAEFQDPRAPDSEDWVSQRARRRLEQTRARCGRGWRVYGNMRALVRLPHKLIWYEHYLPELYDLEADPAERDDLAAREPAILAEMLSELQFQPAPGARAVARGDAPTPPPGLRRSLESLGYIDAGSPVREPAD